MRLVSLSATYYVGGKSPAGFPANFQYGYAGFVDGKKTFCLQIDRCDFIKLYRMYMRKKKPSLSVNSHCNTIREIRFVNYPEK